jgi:type I restriction enzyme R subunit
LKEQIIKINPGIADEIVHDAVKQIITISHPNLVESNHIFHRFLTNGIDVPYRRHDGSEATFKVKLVDTNPENINNRFMAVNQFSIRGKKTRRPDILVFLNGLPVAIFELKNPTDENATIAGAYNQLQTYKNDISDLFFYNEILVISDGTEAKM